MKICMVVHNSVLFDARVRKEARSLSDNNFKVDIFGFSSKEVEVPNHIENCNLKIANLFRNKTKKEKIKVTIFKAIKKISKIKFLDKLVQKYILSQLIEARLLTVVNLIYSEIDGDKYDVIHAHDIIGLMVAMKLKKKYCSLKIVWDAHEFYPKIVILNRPDEQPVYQKLYRQVIIESSSKIDFFITINESAKKYYQKNFPKLPPATILMNASRRPQKKPLQYGSLRSMASLANDQRVVIFHGGLSLGRGIKMLLDVVDRLPVNWSILFMGSGPPEDDISQKILTTKGLRPKGRDPLNILPMVDLDDLSFWTSQADVGVIPYEDIGLNHLYCTPNKIWDYASSGIPIIATNLPEMSLLIKKYNLGFLLPKTFSDDDFLNILKKFDDSKIKEISGNCVKFSEKECWEKYEPNLIKIYEDIAVQLNKRDLI